MTKRISQLSYIEDTKKHHELIGKIAKASTKIAILKSKQSNVDFTYLEGNAIIRESLSGEKKVLRKINISRRKVKVGSKASISNK